MVRIGDDAALLKAMIEQQNQQQNTATAPTTQPIASVPTQPSPSQPPPSPEDQLGTGGDNTVVDGGFEGIINVGTPPDAQTQPIASVPTGDPGERIPEIVLDPPFDPGTGIPGGIDTGTLPQPRPEGEVPVLDPGTIPNDGVQGDEIPFNDLPVNEPPPITVDERGFDTRLDETGIQELIGETDFLPGVDISRINPENSLIPTQINPEASDRLAAIQTLTGGQVADVAGFEGFQDSAPIQALQGQVNDVLSELRGFGAPELSSEAQQARQSVLNTLQEAVSGPDRGALAAEQFDLLAERGRPGFERRRRDIGRQAAALGRVGSGVTTTNLADLGAERDRNLALAGRELAAQAAGLSQEDRLRALSGATSAASFLGGQDIALSDRARAGLQDVAGRLQGLEGQRIAQERDLTSRNLGADRDILASLLGAEGQIFGQEAAARNELRGERGFQVSEDQRALENATGQIRLEEELFNNDFERRLAEAALLGQL